MVITNDLDLNVGQISLTFRNGKLNLRFKSSDRILGVCKGSLPREMLLILVLTAPNVFSSKG